MLLDSFFLEKNSLILHKGLKAAQVHDSGCCWTRDIPLRSTPFCHERS
jgi:hypothetical protein